MARGMLHEAKEFLERKAKLKLKREQILRGGKETGKKNKYRYIYFYLSVYNFFYTFTMLASYDLQRHLKLSSTVSFMYPSI